MAPPPNMLLVKSVSNTYLVILHPQQQPQHPSAFTLTFLQFFLFIVWMLEWPYLYLVVYPREVYVVLNVTTVMHECNCIYFKFFTSRKMGKTSLTFHFHTHLKFNAMEYNKLNDRGENATAPSPSIFVWPEVCPLGFCWDGTSPKFYQNTWKIQISLSVVTCHPCHNCHSGLAINTAFIHNIECYISKGHITISVIMPILCKNTK